MTYTNTLFAAAYGSGTYDGSVYSASGTTGGTTATTGQPTGGQLANTGVNIIGISVSAAILIFVAVTILRWRRKASV